MLQLRISRDRSGVDLSNDVEWSQIALVGGRVGFDRSYNPAALDTFEKIADARIVAKRFDPNTEPRPHDLVSGNELVANFPGHVDGNGEAEAAIDPVDQRIHADHPAVDIAKRAAAVAGINRRVGLEIIRDGIAIGRVQFAATFAAHHTVSESVIEFERRADGKGELTHPDRVAIAELGR